MNRLSCGLALLVFACGDSGTRASRIDESTSPNDGDEIPTLSFTTQTLPAIHDDVPCSGASNDSAVLGSVWFAQTHLMEPSWPFFALTAGRPALVKVDVTSSKSLADAPSPEVKVTAMRGNLLLGSICLAGPPTLPTSHDAAHPNLADSYHATLPETWIAPGVDLRIAVTGGPSRHLPAASLKIGPDPIFTLLTADALLFGDTTPAPHASVDEEYLARAPISKLQHGHFPRPLELRRLVIVPRSDGNDGSGHTAPQPARWADRRPSCTAAEKAAGSCTKYDGRGVIATVRTIAEALIRANGLSTSAIVYAGIGQGAFMGGGLAGGAVGAGDGYALTFNHEVGHSFGMPHWGGVTGAASTDANVVFPYTGDFVDGAGQAQGGAFGRTWAYDPLDGALVPPTCGTGKEMQDPMQRRDACVRAGRIYDHYSDVSALRILRYFSGADTPLRGVVPYRGTDVAYALPATPGREVLDEASDGSAPTFRRWDATTSRYVPTSPDLDQGFKSPHPTGKGPVYFVYGTFTFSSDETSTFYEPILYRGFTMRSVDLTNPSELSALKASGAAAGISDGADLTLRAEYEDGTVRHFLLRTPVRGDVSNPLSTNGFRTFGVNIPADKRLLKTTLLYRRIALREASDSFEGNLAHEPNITASNVYEGARVAATWTAGPRSSPP
jgi:hypothetical protein